MIDEFPALFMGVDKDTSKMLTETISSLLQRGRHAKIHLVLAAQNPTCQNMKVDLGNITARIAFKCAKRNFSETILGEGGAEHLSGQGALLLKSPQFDGLQHIQGINITPKELHRTVEAIKSRTCNAIYLMCLKFTIKIPDGDLSKPLSGALNSGLSSPAVREKASEADRLFANVTLWALGQDHISINMLMNNYQLGWNRASKIVKRLEELGIVDRPESKLPRKVIPACPKDISDELMKFLQDNGCSKGAVISAVHSRKG